MYVPNFMACMCTFLGRMLVNVCLYFRTFMLKFCTFSLRCVYNAGWIHHLGEVWISRDRSIG